MSNASRAPPKGPCFAMVMEMIVNIIPVSNESQSFLSFGGPCHNTKVH